MERNRLPHEGVHVRLGVSSIDGVGVFAIRPIPAGAALFASDRTPIRWVERAALETAGLSEAETSFYHDFGIARGSVIGCPTDFHHLTPGWYMNEPAAGEAPNVGADTECNFFALRDIAEGEELTVRYREFSGNPKSGAGAAALAPRPSGS